HRADIVSACEQIWRMRVVQENDAAMRLFALLVKRIPEDYLDATDATRFDADDAAAHACFVAIRSSIERLKTRKIVLSDELLASEKRLRQMNLTYPFLLMAEIGL